MPEAIVPNEMEVLRILRRHFRLDSAEDVARVRRIIDVLAAHISGRSWHTYLASRRATIESYLFDSVDLVSIAIAISAPVTEVARFCQTGLSPVCRRLASQLDRDLPIFGRPLGNAGQARLSAYQELITNQCLAGNPWAVRMIVGANSQHFTDLRKAVRIATRGQAGVNADISEGSPEKLILNSRFCQAFTHQFGRSAIAVFEPTQGEGDSTAIYADFGLVVSCERKSATFLRAHAKHESQSADLLSILDRGESIQTLLDRSIQTALAPHVLMPPVKRTAESVVPLFPVDWKFDVIDVDPYKYPQPMVELVLPQLADLAMLFVSVNPTEQYGYAASIAALHAQDNTSEFRESMWIFDASRYIYLAQQRRIALTPILVHKRWDQHNQEGIDRIYFLSQRLATPLKIREHLWSLTDGRTKLINRPIAMTRFDVDEPPTSEDIEGMLSHAYIS